MQQTYFVCVFFRRYKFCLRETNCYWEEEKKTNTQIKTPLLLYHYVTISVSKSIFSIPFQTHNSISFFFLSFCFDVTEYEFWLKIYFFFFFRFIWIQFDHSEQCITYSVNYTFLETTGRNESIWQHWTSMTINTLTLYHDKCVIRWTIDE